MSTGQSRRGFDVDLRDGQMMEGELSRILALGGDRIEVKTDHKAHETGRLFLEFEQAGPPSFVTRPSGVAITVAEWWVHILMDGEHILAVLINPTEHVKAIGRIAYRKGMEAKGGDDDLYRGVLVPLAWFLRPTKPVGLNMDGTWGELGWFTEALYREWG